MREKCGPAIGSGAERPLLYAFDLLCIDGQDIRFHALTERRETLAELLTGAGDPLQFSEAYFGDGGSLFRASAELGLEGIVSKRADSAYRSGRSKDWLKIKCFTESDFVVIGTDRDNKTGALRLCYLVRI